jgi:serine/threonine-protein kinase HipA
VSAPYPSDVCLSLLCPTRGRPYSVKGVRDLWGGVKVAPVLPFDRVEFVAFRQKSAGRISISGVQEKISVRLENNVLTPTARDGRYILKPVPRALAETLELVEDVPANEHVTMQIASQVFGLTTAANGLTFFPGGEPAYIVRRFDQEPAGGRKLLQEDFCQLAGRNRQEHGENYKYTGSYEELGRLLRQYCPAHRIELEKLFAQILFNYLFGNGDAHLKNFSLLESAFGDHLLSPCYDLLCTSLHLPMESRTALEMFDDFETESFRVNGFYRRADFLELAARYALLPKRTYAILDRFKKGQAAAEVLIRRSLLSAPAKVRYLALVRDRFSALHD